MKAVTVKLDTGGLEPLLKRVRVAQELGFEQFDLCICNPQAPLGRIVSALQQHNVSVTAIRLKEERRDATTARRPGYSKLGALESAIAERSADMVIETANQLAPVHPQYVVLSGGYVQAPDLNDKLLQLDELLDCDECDQARIDEIVSLDSGLIESQLDQLCRGLHRIAKALEGLEICLLPPNSPFGLLQPERMAQVFEDLATYKLGYWHSTGGAAILRKQGGPKEGDWIERFGTRLKGVYLEDTLGGHGEQAPGLGEIDFEQLAPELARTTVRVMVVDDDKGTKLRFGSEHLSRIGIF